MNAQLSTSFKELSKPKNQKAHMLLDMIEGKMIAEQDYCYNRFRGNISDFILKEGLEIRHQDVPFVNQYGHKGTYRKHYILSIDRDKAREVYEKINK